MDNSESQMSKLFEEGGIADEGMDIDPVSGNEVPPGSLPKEVRDDVPAMLSEGEYVVPADVLRYYGVKFFEDLRTDAKMGLQEMDSTGRIGGEPVDDPLPFPVEDLVTVDTPEDKPVAAAKGGLMGFETGGLNVPPYISTPDLSFLDNPEDGPSASGLEYRTYVNEQGMSITIPFFDGEPMALIPPGYLPEGEAVVKKEEERDIDDFGGGPDVPDAPEPPDYSTMTDEELDEALGKAEKAAEFGKNLRGFPNPISFIAGGFIGLSAKSTINAITAEMENRSQTPLAQTTVTETTVAEDAIAQSTAQNALAQVALSIDTPETFADFEAYSSSSPISGLPSPAAVTNNPAFDFAGWEAYSSSSPISGIPSPAAPAAPISPTQSAINAIQGYLSSVPSDPLGSGTVSSVPSVTSYDAFGNTYSSPGMAAAADGKAQGAATSANISQSMGSGSSSSGSVSYGPSGKGSNSDSYGDGPGGGGPSSGSSSSGSSSSGSSGSGSSSGTASPGATGVGAPGTASVGIGAGPNGTDAVGPMNKGGFVKRRSKKKKK